MDKYFETTYCFQINDMVARIDTEAFKRLAQLCDFNNLGQLTAEIGPGNEVAALLSLLKKRLGKQGLAKFYQALSAMPETYRVVQEAIRGGTCKEMFCPAKSSCN